MLLVGPNAGAADLLSYRNVAAAALPGEIERGSPAERVQQALEAAARPERVHQGTDVTAPLSPQAVPRVRISGDVAVLEWTSERAHAELGVWGTSSGSTGMWPIIGMVFENAPTVTELENRLDGSCLRFNQVMQEARCRRIDRWAWDAYRDAFDPLQPWDAVEAGDG